MPAEGKPVYRIPQSDRFDGDTPGLQWQWQANPKKEFYSLRGHSGIRLYCLRNGSRENLLWYAPNAMTQIPQHRALAAVTRVRLSGEQNGDMASLGIIGHSYAYLGIRKTGHGNELALYLGKVRKDTYEGEAEERLAEICPYEGDTVYLRVEISADKTYRFAWSADGIRYHAIGGANPLTKGTWTGAKLCLWGCNRDNEMSEGYGEYEFIHIEERESR